VHVYTIGYMSDDPGYTRFFSYISLFTFSMLMLVMSNNFMQLFFGWERWAWSPTCDRVLVYAPERVFANFKAFVVNRVGDFDFVLGIAGVFYYTNSVGYCRGVSRPLRSWRMPCLPLTSNTSVEAITLICICLFIGAMGKSAQVPACTCGWPGFDGGSHADLRADSRGNHGHRRDLHGSAHVTAVRAVGGALSFVLVIGATTAFFMDCSESSTTTSSVSSRTRRSRSWDTWWSPWVYPPTAPVCSI